MLFAGKAKSARQSVINTFETLDLSTGVWSILPAESLGFSVPSANNIRPLENLTTKEGVMVFSDSTEGRLLIYDGGEWLQVPSPTGFGETYGGLTVPRSLVCRG